LVLPSQTNPGTGIYKYHALLSLFIFYIQPLKMDLTEGSETSANHNLMPEKYPKEHKQYSKHGKSFKSRINSVSFL
jgi:hypothetical protein